MNHIYFGTTVLRATTSHVDVTPSTLGLDFEPTGSDILYMVNGDQYASSFEFGSPRFLAYPDKSFVAWIVEIRDKDTLKPMVVNGAIRANWIYVRRAG